MPLDYTAAAARAAAARRLAVAQEAQRYAADPSSAPIDVRSFAYAAEVLGLAAAEAPGSRGALCAGPHLCPFITKSAHVLPRVLATSSFSLRHAQPPGLVS